MLSKQLESKPRKKFLKKAIKDFVERKGYSQIRAQVDGYEDPAELRSVNEGDVYMPDITARKRGRKSYFDIAIKPEKQSLRKRIVSKWKLLQTLSSMKDGQLVLLAPRGHYAFAQRICDLHNIQARIVKI